MLPRVGWIQCEDVDALWMDVRLSALLIRDDVTMGSRKYQIVTASVENFRYNKELFIVNATTDHCISTALSQPPALPAKARKRHP
jgi:hypothetical protein